MRPLSTEGTRTPLTLTREAIEDELYGRILGVTLDELRRVLPPSKPNQQPAKDPVFLLAIDITSKVFEQFGPYVQPADAGEGEAVGGDG